MIWIALLVFLSFITGSVLYVFAVSDRKEREMNEYLREATMQRAAAVTQQLESDMQVLRGVAISFGEMNLTDKQRVRTIINNINRSNGFVQMGLVTRDGLVSMVDTRGTVMAEMDISHVSVFRKSLSGREGVSDTFWDEAAEDDVNYFTVPVWQNRRVEYVLCAVNSENVLKEIMTPPVFQGVGYFAMINRDGVIIGPASDPDPSVHLGASIDEISDISPEERVEITRSLYSNQEGVFRFNVRGETHLSVIIPLGVNDWFMISVVPHRAMTNYFQQTAVGTSLLIAVAALIFLFLLLWQVRVMTQSQKALERLAYVDELTGLRSYAKLCMDAGAVFKENPAKQYAIWCFDIKQFNVVNDIFGIKIGDQVLHRLGEIFTTAEAEDCFAGRIAADQFAGIRPYHRREELEEWFQRLYESFLIRKVIPSEQMKVDCSMGIYCVEDEIENLSIEEMISRAAIAKKEAKNQAGSAMDFFTIEMGEKIRWNAELEAAAPLALQNKEFEIFLQPKVSIQTEYRVSAAEVLVRWNHPQHGYISPGEFVPLFEQSGFIVELDRYIFEEACRWYVDYQSRKMPAIRLAVNVSRQGFLREDFVAYYQQTKQRYGIADGLLELEFTEGVIFQDYWYFHQAVLAFQQRGFMCAIDDFGAGYSSLNVLKNLPIDVLKLDAAFFRDSQELWREQLVIEGFLDMAHRLGIRTVAEGVEKREQVEFLKSAGCDIIQGYFFSKPLPVASFETYVQKHRDGIVLDMLS